MKVISKPIVLNLLRFARQREIDLNEVIQNIGLNLADESDFVFIDKFAILMELLVHKSGDTSIGLYVGEQYNLAALGIVGQIIQTSRTVREGVEKSCANFNLISNVLTLGLKITPSNFYLDFNMDKEVLRKFPVASKHLILSSMVFAYKEIAFLIMDSHRPITTFLTFEEEKKEEYQRVFNSPIEFNATQNRMEFEASLLNEKVLYADYELLILLEQVACKRLTKQANEIESFTDKTKSVIYTLLNPATPSLKTVAKNFHMTERNVQRKLKEEGTSYSKLLLEFKKEIVLDYLKKDLSIKEISYLMGYSEPSAFVNAFKKWYGKTPLTYKLSS